MLTLYYRLKVPIYEWNDRRPFYRDPTFKSLDQKLRSGPNPYTTAKIAPYGETPLHVLKVIAETVHLGPGDHFVDLGCGLGRATLFMSHFFGCRATGIDLTPTFIKRARECIPNPNVQFHCQDFLSYNFEGATCVYLYGTTYSDACLEKLRQQLSKLPTGSHVVSVSEPLLHHSHAHRRELSFPWGVASIFFEKKT